MNTTLAMIVKNESKILPRCLDSVKDYVNSIYVHDTGSKASEANETIKIIEAYNGKIERVHWESFGHNRAKVIADASKNSDYVLLADADFEYVFDKNFEWPQLTDDVYFIQIKDTDMSYDYAALLKADRVWEYEGRTHECLKNQPREIERISGVHIIHHADGKNRKDKFIRDKILLHQDLESDHNPRTVFYLGQTYECLGDVYTASYYYKERMSMKNAWDEERYVAALRLGRIKNDIGILFEAMSIRPQRLEALYEILWRLRHKSLHHAVYSLASNAMLTSAEGLTDRLFVEEWVWRYGIKYEQFLAAYNTGDKFITSVLGEELLEKNLPSVYREGVEATLLAY